jgi:hypothetical protein
MLYDKLYKREAHVYPVSEVIKKELGWISDFDCLQIAEVLYNEGMLKKPKEQGQ